VIGTHTIDTLQQMKSISAMYMTGLEISAYVTLHGMCIPSMLLIATNRAEVKSYGINGKLLKWLKDYISERKQQILLNNSISSLGTLKAGIPQGSV
jgi:late competence protein required for DNA uptake (superfamily II DNA/RNA helicase)